MVWNDALSLIRPRKVANKRLGNPTKRTVEGRRLLAATAPPTPGPGARRR